jgi:ribosomal protein S18 acetylase RimI-like enzyme
MTTRDCAEAGRFCEKTTRWMWERYLRRVYPKEASEFDARHKSAKELRDKLKDPNTLGLVALADGRICGIVLGLVYGKSGYGFINWIAVDPKHQHEGIGIRLMAAAEEHFKKRKCHKIGLHTIVELTPALRLYLKFGMTPESYMREQWWGADFVMMSKWLGHYRKH